MSFEHVKQTTTDEGAVTFCGRFKGCLIPAAKRAGVRITHAVIKGTGTRQERRRRNEDYHRKGFDARPGRIQNTISLTGVYQTSVSK